MITIFYPNGHQSDFPKSTNIQVTATSLSFTSGGRRHTFMLANIAGYAIPLEEPEK